MIISLKIFKTYFFLFILLFANIQISAQIIFETSYPSGAGYSVKETFDGGFIIAGTTYSQLLLLKTDHNGNLQWQKTFGVTTGIHPEHKGYDVIQLNDSGYLIAGVGKPFNSNTFAYYIRTDMAGNLIWEQKVYSDISPSLDQFYGLRIFEDQNGNFISGGGYDAASGNNSDYILIKLSASGNVINITHIDIAFEEELSDFIYTDSALYFAGTVWDNSNTFFNILKTDTSGNILLNYNYGLNQNSIVGATSFLLDSAENIIVTGIANYLSGANYFINKYSIAGDTLSAHNFPVNPQWQVIYSQDILQVKDRYFVTGSVTGNTPAEGMIACSDTNGTQLFRQLFGGSMEDNLFAMSLTSDSNLIAVGYTETSSGSDIYLVCIDPTVYTSVQDEHENLIYNISNDGNTLILNFFDMNVSDIKKLYIHSVDGRLVSAIESKNRQINIPISDWDYAIYILSIEFGEKFFSHKIIR
jgi:hypothetical protein